MLHTERQSDAVEAEIPDARHEDVNVNQVQAAWNARSLLEAVPVPACQLDVLVERINNVSLSCAQWHILDVQQCGPISFNLQRAPALRSEGLLWMQGPFNPREILWPSPEDILLLRQELLLLLLLG
jgi:hypothetical protein